MVRLTYTRTESGYRTNNMVFFDAAIYGLVSKKGYKIFNVNGELIGSSDANSLRSAKRNLRDHLKIMGINFYDEVRSK